MSDHPKRMEGVSGAHHRFKYFDFIMAAFVTILLLSNLIGAAKQAEVTLPIFGPVAFGAGVLFFPVSYIIGDVMTEVYGYAHARRVIWTGCAALLFMALMAWVVVNIPAEPGWALATREGGYDVLGQKVDAPNQAAYISVFGSTWRIVAASLIAFWCGEFVNSFVLAKMKILTAGSKLWTRTIGSTIFGEAVDSALFYPIAFLGLPGWSIEKVVTFALTQWFLKTAWEVVLTPVTYAVVGFLKRREGVEVFDTNTHFSPFAKE